MMTLQRPLPRTRRTMPVVFDTRVVTGSGGGPEKTILNSPRFLEPLGYRMLCGYLTPPDDPGYAEIESKARRANAPLVTIHDRGPHDLRLVRDLLRVCRKENVSIWHGHDYKSNALGLLLKRFHPMRLVTTTHGWVQQTARTPLYYKIDKWCLPRYESVICVSEDLYQECRNLGVRARNCHLIDNAIDAEDYRRRRPIAEAKAALGLKAGSKLIGAVGRLSEEKGFDLLIEALKPLLDSDSDLQVMIVGEGGERARLENQIASLGLTHRIALPGWRSDVRDVFEAMDLFVLSSRREGLPNVMLEAMALEVPVLSTSVNGIPRLLRDGLDGVLIPPNDLNVLTQGMTRLMNDTTMRQRFAAAGRQRILESFSFPARMAKIAALYDQLLAKPRKRGGK